jgi:hypothetical protein
VPPPVADIHHPGSIRMVDMHMDLSHVVTLMRRGPGPGRPRRALDWAATGAFVIGGLLLVWSAYVHYHLWSEPNGYKLIPTIGNLFLAQWAAGFVVGVGAMVVRRLWAAVIGIGLALTTLTGFLISVVHGLFGFQDSWLAPFAKQSFWLEVAAVVVLGVAGALSLAGSASHTAAEPAPVGPAV